MSIMREGLNTWIKKFQPPVAIMGDDTGGGTICDYMPESTTMAMEDIAKEAQHHRISKDILDADGNVIGHNIDVVSVEAGAPIEKDLSLGIKSYGTKHNVAIIRDDNTVGTYHAHVASQDVKPSKTDITTAMTFNDSVFCIGTHMPLTGTKIKCYTPHEPQWSDLRKRLVKWQDTLNELNKRAVDTAGFYGKTYRTKSGNPKRITLRNLFRQLANPQIINEIRAPGVSLEQLEQDALNKERDVDLQESVTNKNGDDLLVAQAKRDNAVRAYEIAQMTYSTDVTKQLKHQLGEITDALADLRKSLRRAKKEDTVASLQEQIDELVPQWRDMQQKYNDAMELSNAPEITVTRRNLQEAESEVSNLTDKLNINNQQLAEARTVAALARKKYEMAKSSNIETGVTEAQNVLKELDELEGRRLSLVSELEEESDLSAYPHESRPKQLIFDDCKLLWEGIYIDEEAGIREIFNEL